jgi:hypothetical protein
VSIQQLLLGGGEAIPTDPLFADVKLLMHFDGADGSTTFTDVIGNTVTANGDAQIDTAQFKYGGASGLFDGTGDYLSIPQNGDNWDIGASTHATVEFWLRMSSLAAIGMPIGNRTTSPNAGWEMFVDTDGSLYAQTPVTSAGTAAGIITTNTWYHIAWQTSSTVAYIYVDGVCRSTGTVLAPTGNANIALNIGRRGFNGAFPLAGHIDDLRITVGTTARYSGTTLNTTYFAPPAVFPNS